MASAMDMFNVRCTPATVLCCLCGDPITPNPSNVCVSCLRARVDITEGVQKQLSVLFCPECGRYLQPPRTWLKAQPESKELLTFCLKRIKNLSKLKLVDAAFVWTEPHSKRLKIKLTVQKEVMNGAILQQAFVAEFVVEDRMCEQCSRTAANPDQWQAVVQVRQKADHKRTFLFLEQLILKHGANANTINIKQMHDGVDFYYSNRSHAVKFVDFLNAIVPIQFRSDKQLVSQDSHSNTYNYKFTFSVEICPICKDDIICLPPKLASSMGCLPPLLLCSRISNSLQLLDPSSGRTVFMDAQQFWRSPFRPLMSARQLVEYVVLDIDDERGPSAASVSTAFSQAAGGGGGGRGGGGAGASKWVMAVAQVARVSDFGRNDRTFTVRTHLGKYLQPGDRALGYDILGANLNSDELDKYDPTQVADVVLVKKSYEEKRRKRRGKARAWTLKSLNMEVDAAAAGGGRGDVEREMVEKEIFMDEIEEDPEMRSKINVFRNPTFVKKQDAKGTAEGEMEEVGDDEGEEPPEIPLEELLDDLTLEDDEEEEDGEAMDM